MSSVVTLRTNWGVKSSSITAEISYAGTSDISDGKFTLYGSMGPRQHIFHSNYSPSCESHSNQNIRPAHIPVCLKLWWTELLHSSVVHTKESCLLFVVLVIDGMPGISSCLEITWYWNMRWNFSSWLTDLAFKICNKINPEIYS